MGEEKTAKKPGQPTKKDKIDMDKVVKLCIAGCTNLQIAIAVGVSEKSLYTYMKNDKSFLQTIKNNQALADAIIEKSLFERATGYTHPEEKIFQYKGKIIKTETLMHYPPDPTSMIFWLKNRKPKEWRDKQDIDLNGSITIVNKIPRPKENNG